MFKILTAFEEYTIAIGGVVEGMALDIDAAKPAATIGGIGLKPAPIAREAARGHIITAEAVLDEAYDITKPIMALITNMLNSVILYPTLFDIRSPIKDARPLFSIPRPSTKPPPNRNMMFQSIAFSISFQFKIGRLAAAELLFISSSLLLFPLILINPTANIINKAGIDSGTLFAKLLNKINKMSFSSAFSFVLVL